MKKKYAGDDSENEFSVDEPEELQGSDDDWTPGCGEVCWNTFYTSEIELFGVVLICLGFLCFICYCKCCKVIH